MKNNSFYGTNATHVGGKGELFHDWYPYLEGYSSAFVESVKKKYLNKAKCILEPFAGVGTTPIQLAQQNVTCYYCEVNPVLLHLIKTKSEILNLSDIKKKILIKQLIDIKKNISKIAKLKKNLLLIKHYKILFNKSIFFEKSNFNKILQLKTFSNNIKNNNILKSIFDISVYSSLLKSSLLKRAGDVRFRTKNDLKKNKPDDILLLTKKKIELILNDVINLKVRVTPPKFFVNNAKDLINENFKKFDGVITSPPYLNGTNYFRNTKLELWFMNFINDKINLRNFRDLAITSGINDVNQKKVKNTLKEVKDIYNKSLINAYDKRIPKMINDYFYDMKLVLLGIKNNIKKNSCVCIDIGDSIFNKIHIPTDKILIEIAKNIGFKILDRIVLRKRLSHSKKPLNQVLLVFSN